MLRLVLALMKKKMQNEVYSALRQINLEKMIEDLFDLTGGQLVAGKNSSGEEITCLVANNRVLGVTDTSDDTFEDVEKLCTWLYFMFYVEGRILNLSAEKSE